MKVNRTERTDISATVQSACTQLETLKKQISENVSSINENDLISLISILQSGAHHLATEIRQSSEIAPLDPKIKTNLVNLMHAIQKSAAFSQALGPHQVELMGVFTRFENSLRKAEQKVAKVDADPLRKH